MIEFSLDEQSLLLTCPAGDALKSIETDLSVLGLTLGYHPARPVRTIREALMRRVPNLLAERYGEIDDICVAIKAVHKGHSIQTKNVPRSATGPDFKKLLAVNGGASRLIAVTLRVSLRPEGNVVHRIRWARKQNVDEFLKFFWAAGIRPAALNQKGPKTLEITLEGLSEIVRAETSELRALVLKTRGVLHAQS